MQAVKKLKAYSEPVESYTYNDILCGTDIDKISGDYRVIVLDRYDMYKGIGQNLTKRYKDRSIVLIDYKEGNMPYVENEICFIDLTENRIEVSL